MPCAVEIRETPHEERDAERAAVSAGREANGENWLRWPAVALRRRNGSSHGAHARASERTSPFENANFD